MTKHAWQLRWQLQDAETRARNLIHNQDRQLDPGFDTVFASERVESVRMLYLAPKANAVAERRVHLARQERLDPVLIMTEAYFPEC